MARNTIAEVYNAQEGMDDDMFEDAAQLVGIMGKMVKRGLNGAPSGSLGSSGGTGRSRGGEGVQVAVPPIPDLEGMDNPI